MKVQENDNPGLFNDVHGLNNIKANPDKAAALREASGQFEALFLQSVLKHMRQASDALADEDGALFNSRQQKFYRSMFDSQLAVEMSQRQSLGIADMLVRQLGQHEAFKPHGQVVALDKQSVTAGPLQTTSCPEDTVAMSPVPSGIQPRWLADTAPLSLQIKSGRQGIPAFEDDLLTGEHPADGELL